MPQSPLLSDGKREAISAFQHTVIILTWYSEKREPKTYIPGEKFAFSPPAQSGRVANQAKDAKEAAL